MRDVRDRVEPVHRAQHVARVGVAPGRVAWSIDPRLDRGRLNVAQRALQARNAAARRDPGRDAVAYEIQGVPDPG